MEKVQRQIVGAPVPSGRQRARLSHASTLVLRAMCFFMTLCSGRPLSATILIAALGPDAIYIAADSADTWIGELPPVRGAGVCKIQQAGRYFFAYAGIAADRDRGFDLDSLLTAALKQPSSQNLVELVQNLNKTLEPKLSETVQAIHRKHPDEYKTWLEGKDVFIFFATWEGGEPLLLTNGWRMNKEGQALYLGLKRAGRDTGNFLIAGSPDGAEAYFGSHGVELSGMDPTAMLRKLVEVEIEHGQIDNTIAVGPPIAILTIRRGGATWSEQANCPDIKGY